MEVGKKTLGRFGRRAKEWLGGEVMTDTSNDFKALEAEVAVRQEGFERIHKAMHGYVRAVSKRNEGGEGGKLLPIGYLGGTMVAHGQDFDNSSEFGQCLNSFGRTNEIQARIQEQYVADATATWLESLDRSLLQMRDYQTARKKLESRRLAYDTSRAKMQKAKSEDYRLQEEEQQQKLKYEEAHKDVYRRMEDIREAEADSICDLRSFLDAQLTYHDQCREALLRLRDEWPASTPARRPPISRTTTAQSFSDRSELAEVEPSAPRPVIRSHRTTSCTPGTPYSNSSLSRTSTFEGPTTPLRSRGSPPAPVRVMSDSASLHSNHSQLFPVNNGRNYDTNYDGGSTSYETAKSTRYVSGSVSGSTGHPLSARPVSTALQNGNAAPSSQCPIRAKKPPPPPPPKRIGMKAGM